MHGGLTREYLTKYGGLEEMNAAVWRWYDTPLPEEWQNDDGYIFQTVDEVIQNANARAKYISSTQPECLGGGIRSASPVWMRDYSSPVDSVPKFPQKAQKMIDNYLEEVSKEVGEGVVIRTICPLQSWSRSAALITTATSAYFHSLSLVYTS